MPTTDLLKSLSLSRNPFTDRTAEKSALDPISLYIHADLRGFKPCETTYVFFGRRGSGKTTIRLQMEDAYRAYNEQAAASGKKGFFIVDICKPGHLTTCLTLFMESIKGNIADWDSVFSENWTTADLIDSILSFSATELVKRFTANNEEAKQMHDVLRSDPKLNRQFLLLSHLYARTDLSTLAHVRTVLMRPKYTAAQIAARLGVGVSASAAVVAMSREPIVANAVAAQSEALWDRVCDAAPFLRTHPKLIFTGLTAATTVAAVCFNRWQVQRGIDRAAALQRNVRVTRPQPLHVLTSLVNHIFNPQDTPDTVRLLCLGVSAHQKLDLLQHLVRALGFEGLTVFGDCFDEVTLLDPVRFPGAIKAFAREVCRNDVLNFGRLHFFFPDSRLSLDLNTDRTLKEARFDRHFVRDLTWSRHQLEELAERRFKAAQQALRAEVGAMAADSASLELSAASFVDLFKKVRGEDFSSYLSKLSTPRELMIMMTEMFARIEANPEGGLTGQDMEISVTKALEQSV